MKPFIIYHIFFTTLIFIIACNHISSKNYQEDQPAAIVDNDTIFLSSIDRELKNKLYDLLYYTYVIRRTKTEEAIGYKILEKEAQKNKLSYLEFINKIIDDSIKSGRMLEFSVSRRFNIYGIPVYQDIPHNVSLNTYEGQEILKKVYSDYILNNIIDSLKHKYKTSILLSPPLLPSIDFSDIRIHLKGNLNSKTTLLIISDVNCSQCKEKYNDLNSLMKKYEKEVKFGYISYSGEISCEIIALEAAANQNKFWELLDILYQKNSYQCDSLFYHNIVDKLKLNIQVFESDMKSDKIANALKTSFEKLNKKGIYGTPSILINNKLVPDVMDVGMIEKMLKSEINK